MKKGHLSEYFIDFAVKTLSAVEADRHRSNQHEFDGVSRLRAMLGDDDKRNIPAVFIYLNDDDPEPLREEGFLSWYDARRAHPTRTEYRLYFPDTVVSDNATEGDLLIIAQRPDGTLMVIIAEGESTVANQLLWLFGVGEAKLPGFSVKGELEADQVRLEFASRLILEEIGVVVEQVDENYLDQMLERFGGRFPTTREFSDYARRTLGDIDLTADPDAAVLALMEREEVLFRTMERHLIGDRLQGGFAEVDDFLKFSLSVQNRRKSRAGSALENHLEHLFGLLGLKCDRTPVTEGKAKPDFLFPGTAAYQDLAFPAELLTMLGVKSTCKDRWRQVLAEADRIADKHLLTLEPSISTNQTDEMQQRRLQLVLPRGLHETFTKAQQGWLMPVSDLVALVRDRQVCAGF
ncbi:type II restriction endonuclease [Sphingomonas corticis]|uniref:Restriction endonuclease n=1 Tax=Sphingomonas corticis TaxID=2722791 RepID=A0ABX1CQU5_9SPHN|nr:type II restriction endonuclease [Sphingomonas corticis]NJR78742.1 restriction endonuclease [Sphingomonas corticis]